MRLRSVLNIVGILLLGGLSPLHAGEVRVAVAANFAAAMKAIAADFERSSGHRVVISHGSTGQLYAQIRNGAPFDLFLAADQRRPRLLQQQGIARDRFTYAIGSLVLWSSDHTRSLDERVLRDADFGRLAIANPKIAPYGRAAEEVLHRLGLYDAVAPRLVRGESIAQTYQFVASGNAQLGFIALAQVAFDDTGSRWLVPDGLYRPLRQDAVMLRRGAGNAAAGALFDYLNGDRARAIIHEYGYRSDDR